MGCLGWPEQVLLLLLLFLIRPDITVLVDWASKK